MFYVCDCVMVCYKLCEKIYTWYDVYRKKVKTRVGNITLGVQKTIMNMKISEIELKL